MTVDEILEKELSGGRSFSFAWRIFLDQFIISSTEQMLVLINSVPRCLNDQRQLAYCAAGLHKLCREYELKQPEWIRDKSFILDKPYFPGATTDLLKLVCLGTTE